VPIAPGTGNFQHGADARLTNLRTVLAGDCPRIGGAIYEQFGVHYPQLVRLWRGEPPGLGRSSFVRSTMRRAARSPKVFHRIPGRSSRGVRRRERRNSSSTSSVFIARIVALELERMMRRPVTVAIAGTFNGATDLEASAATGARHRAAKAVLGRARRS
jgi:hypothetical protein